MLNPIQREESVMVDTDFSEVLRENWTGICRECEWEHTNIGSQAVIIEARIHLNNAEEGEHVADVYRDDDLMAVVESAFETGEKYLAQDAPPLREREQEHERIAREVADPDDGTID